MRVHSQPLDKSLIQRLFNLTPSMQYDYHFDSIAEYQKAKEGVPICDFNKKDTHYVNLREVIIARKSQGCFTDVERYHFNFEDSTGNLTLSTFDQGRGLDLIYSEEGWAKFANSREGDRVDIRFLRNVDYGILIDLDKKN